MKAHLGNGVSFNLKKGGDKCVILGTTTTLCMYVVIARLQISFGFRKTGHNMFPSSGLSEHGKTKFVMCAYPYVACFFRYVMGVYHYAVCFFHYMIYSFKYVM